MVLISGSIRGYGVLIKQFVNKTIRKCDALINGIANLLGVWCKLPVCKQIY